MAEVSPVQCGKKLHEGMNSRRWGSLGSSQRLTTTNTYRGQGSMQGTTGDRRKGRFSQGTFTLTWVLDTYTNNVKNVIELYNQIVKTIRKRHSVDALLYLFLLLVCKLLAGHHSSLFPTGLSSGPCQNWCLVNISWANKTLKQDQGKLKTNNRPLGLMNTLLLF